MMDMSEICCTAGLFDSRYAAFGRRALTARNADAYELQFFDNDNGVIYVNDEVIPIGHNRVLCIRPGDACRISLPYRAYYVRVQDGDGQLCRRMDDWSHSFTIQNAEQMISQVKQIAEAERAGNALEQQAGLLSLIAHLDAEHARAALIDGKARKKTRESIHVGLNYIEQHFCEKCTLKEIAAVAGRSPIYFHDVFHEVMGVTPYEYIAQLRLDEAKRLLALTDEDPCVIAESCGFCSQSYFNFVFKKSTGITPLNYRRAQAARYLDSAEKSE